jgi:hypothetical protein
LHASCWFRGQTNAGEHPEYMHGMRSSRWVDDGGWQEGVHRADARGEGGEG